MIPTVLSECEHGCSISWFLGFASADSEKFLGDTLRAIVRLFPTFVHIFGRAAESMHDRLDVAFADAEQFAPTVWSTKLDVDEAIFEIFRVDMPEDRDIDRWSMRLIIIDESLPEPEKTALQEKLGDPDRSIQEYFARD